MTEEERKERKRESQRKYYERNREKISAYQKERWRKETDRMREIQKASNARNKRKIQERKRKYRALMYVRERRRELSLKYWRNTSQSEKDRRNAKTSIVRESGIPRSEIPKEIVEARVAIMKIRREIRKAGK